MVIGVIIIGVILVLVRLVTQNSSGISSILTSSVNPTNANSPANSSNSTGTPGDQDNQNGPGGEENSAEKGSYVSYSADKLSSDKNIIFFAASWCPSCRQLDQNLQASINNIPAGVNILKADYDRETVLRQKYGITLQHSFAQVDAEGNLIKKWNGLYNQFTLEELLAEVG